MYNIESGFIKAFNEGIKNERNFRAPEIAELLWSVGRTNFPTAEEFITVLTHAARNNDAWAQKSDNEYALEKYYEFRQWPVSHAHGLRLPKHWNRVCTNYQRIYTVNDLTISTAAAEIILAKSRQFNKLAFRDIWDTEFVHITDGVPNSLKDPLTAIAYRLDGTHLHINALNEVCDIKMIMRRLTYEEEENLQEKKMEYLKKLNANRIKQAIKDRKLSYTQMHIFAENYDYETFIYKFWEVPKCEITRSELRKNIIYPKFQQNDSP